MTLLFQTNSGYLINLKTLLQMCCQGPEALRREEIEKVLQGALRVGVLEPMAMWLMIERPDLVEPVESTLFSLRGNARL